MAIRPTITQAGLAPDFLVVGGGIVGRSVAHCLAGGGASVTLVDRGCAGGQASGAAAGMLAPLSESHGPGPFLDLGLAGLACHADLAPRLEEESGAAVGYVACGLLRVAFDEAGAEELRRRVAWQRAIAPVEWLEPADLARLEPALAAAVCGAFYPQEHNLSAPHLVYALTRAAARRGVRFLEGTEVTGLLTRGSRVTGARLGGAEPGSLEAGHVVIAAGAWTGRIGEWLGADLPVSPVRGQLISFERLPAPVTRIVFAGGKGYAVPKAAGNLIVGATEERAGFSTDVTAAGLEYLSRTALAMFPALGGARFQRAWAGLRPWSTDGLPLIGPVPGWERVTVASGHHRNGILLGPITGKLLAERLLGRMPPEAGRDPLAPFDPGRFASGGKLEAGMDTS